MEGPTAPFQDRQEPAHHRHTKASPLMHDKAHIDAPYVFQVGPRPVWKDPQHPFRTDKNLHIAGIPTLVHWTSQGGAQRLTNDLERASSPADAEAVARKFIAENKAPHAHTNGAANGTSK